MKQCVAAAVFACVLGAAGSAAAGRVPNTILRSFAFPFSFDSGGMVSDLVVPAGTGAKLSFASGKVAIIDTPAPMQRRPGQGRRNRDERRFSWPSGPAPRARLLLDGVVDGNGSLVTNSGNEFVIDAAVSPGSAATSPPPFVFSFDITAGMAFVDVPLPLAQGADSAVRVQILGVSVVDPDGQPFAVLGFELAPAPATPVPGLTPVPSATPQPEGRCFKTAHCGGESFPASRDGCCRFAGTQNGPVLVTASWCPPDQFDPSTGQCAADGCVACQRAPADCSERHDCEGPCAVECADGSIRAGLCQADLACRCSAGCGPTPTPAAEPCANLASCAGSCTRTCADGTVVTGQCAPDTGGACECSAACAAPTPCGVGECFDTMMSRCTGQACDSTLHCPLPNQICDVGGRRCPCQQPPPVPQGHICCQCKDKVPACFDFTFVEVQAICPPGCDAFLNHECDATTEACVPLAPCASDKDCDDGNACTIDHCIAGGCSHDCVCVGRHGCGPGPPRH